MQKKIISRSVDEVSISAHALSFISKVGYIDINIPSILSLSSLDGCGLNIKLKEQTFQVI
jgi:seryl-tRNA synthetase